MGKTHETHTYSISTHSVEDVLSMLEKLGKPLRAGGPQVLYCDTEGICMFDDPEKDYIASLEALLNQEAGGGKRLVQVLFRPHQMIAIWEKNLGES